MKIKKLFVISFFGFFGMQINAMNDACYKEQRYSTELERRFRAAVKENNWPLALELFEEIDDRTDMFIQTDFTGGFWVGFTEEQVDNFANLINSMRAQYELSKKPGRPNDKISFKEFLKKD